MKLCKRGTALLLVFVLAISMAGPVSAADFPKTNTGKRHVVCDTLSRYAEDYYTGNYTWDKLSMLEGIATDSSLKAMDGEIYKAAQELMTQTMTNSVSYKSLTGYWKWTDTQPGMTDATLIYCDCQGSGYNREHVWPKSRASFYQSGGGSDLHHLRPADSATNSTRSNYTMGDVKGVVSNYSTKDYNGKTVLWYSNGDDLVEVNDNIKGDVARIMLYVYTRWGEPNLCENVDAGFLPDNGPDSGGNNGLKVMKDLDTVLRWCEEDPVDDWEMSRNDCVQGVQGNRNIFIDYPELAWLIFNRDIPGDMQTPSGYAVNNAKPSFEIKAVSNNNDWGTVEVKGSRIICTPMEGYCVSDAEVVPADGAKLTREGNVIHLSDLTKPVTVNVTFAEKSTAKITYVLPEGASTAEGAPTSSYVGDEITLPGVTGEITVGDYTYSFEGWVNSNIEDTTDLGEKKVYAAGDTYMVNSTAERIYGLYSYQVASAQGDANTFTLVTEAPADWSGEYVMSGIRDGSEFIHKTSSPDLIGKTDVAVPIANTGISKDGSTLTDVTSDYIIVIEKLSNGKYSMRLKGCADDTYFSYSGSGNSLSIDTVATDSGAQWEFSMGEEAIAIASVGTAGRYLQFNPSSAMFRCYTGSQKDVYLYGSSGSFVTHYLTPGKATPCEHVWGQWEVTKAPTCTEKGTETRTCSVCGEQESRDIAATGHNWGLWEVKSRPTAEKQGVKQRTCSYCNEVETAAFSENFKDVEQDKFYADPVDWAVVNEITEGNTDGTFTPDKQCTRAQVVTFLWRAAGKPAPASTKCNFKDVHSDDYFKDAVLWAVEEGITKGVESDRFGWDETCTRAQTVTLLWRAAGKPAPKSEKNPFRDVGNNEYYTDAVLWTNENKITNGYEADVFAPNDICNRGQVVTFLYRDYINSK